MVSGKLYDDDDVDDDDDDDEDDDECLLQMFLEPYSKCTKVRALAYVRIETVPQLCCSGIK